MITTPLSAEVLALPTVERLRLAARLIDAGELPDVVLLLLERAVVDVLWLCITREVTWRDEATH